MLVSWLARLRTPRTLDQPVAFVVVYFVTGIADGAAGFRYISNTWLQGTDLAAATSKEVRIS